MSAPPAAGTGLFTAVVVVELHALRPLSSYPPPAQPRRKAQYGPYIPDGAKPRYVMVLPHNDPTRLPSDLLDFCFPDLDHLLRSPYSYEHVSDEFVFTLTLKAAPYRLHGFCRRYRIGGPGVGHRLDLPPFTSANESETAGTPSFQCICILSEL